MTSPTSEDRQELHHQLRHLATCDPQLVEHAIHFRRHMHAHPEISRNEHFTTQRIFETLSALPGAHVRRLDPTGVIADFGPLHTGQKRIALRADIDALAMDEKTGVDYQSTVPGAAHSCGHDVHTSILVAIARILSQCNLPVPVRLIFQPAEEVMPGGALDVIAQQGLSDVASIAALHVDPRIDVGTVGTRIGAITSAADRLELEISGAGGHTSRPHLTTDIISALGSVVTQLPAVLARRVDPGSKTVVAFGQIHAGSIANAIPKFGHLEGTVRTADLQTWKDFDPLVTQICENILASFDVQCELTLHRGLPPVANNAELVEGFRQGILSQSIATCEVAQSSGGEDFAWYLQSVPGFLFRLGTRTPGGSQVDLHQPDFNVDEDCIGVGIRAMVEALIAMHRLHSSD